MESRNSGILGVTKYEMPPAMLATSQGLDAHRERMNAMRSIRIPLHSRKYPGLYAIVDEADAELVSGYRWRPRKTSSTFYATTVYRDSTGLKRYDSMHRIVLGLDHSSVVVDHINHDGLDNRRSNLRTGTQQQNSFNFRRRSVGTSSYKGVSWSTRERKWVAQITHGRRAIALGNHHDETFAARVYDVAATELFGEFACLNFPSDSLQDEAVRYWEGVKAGPHHSSRFYGVYWRRDRSRWVAQITANGRTWRLGSFLNEEDAARAYDAAALELHGDKARLNFPEEGGVK